LVMIEHDMDVLRGAVSDIAVLHLGKLVTRGTVAEVQQNELVRELYLGQRRQIEKTSEGESMQLGERGPAK